MRRIWTVIRERRTLFLAPLGLALAAWVVIILLVSSQWEGMAVIQIGQIEQNGRMIPLEPANNLVDRLRLRAFKDRILRSVGMSDDEEDAGARLFRERLQVKQGLAADLVEIRVRGHSIEQTARLIDAVVASVIVRHRELYEPAVDKLKSRLELVGAELAGMDAQRSSLRNGLAQGTGVGGQANGTIDGVLQSYALSETDKLINALRERKAILEDSLTSLRTYPTRLAEQVFIDNKPVYPKRFLLLALALLCGFFVGVALALGADSRAAAVAQGGAAA